MRKFLKRIAPLSVEQLETRVTPSQVWASSAEPAVPTGAGCTENPDVADFVRPADGAITSPFALERIDPVGLQTGKFKSRPHHGVDIAGEAWRRRPRSPTLSRHGKTRRSSMVLIRVGSAGLPAWSLVEFRSRKA